jgi:hypothetical protein
MSLDIAYHVLNVIHLKLDVIIGLLKYIYLVHIVVLFSDTGRDLPLHI